MCEAGVGQRWQSCALSNFHDVRIHRTQNPKEPKGEQDDKIIFDVY